MRGQLQQAQQSREMLTVSGTELERILADLFAVLGCRDI